MNLGQGGFRLIPPPCYCRSKIFIPIDGRKERNGWIRCWATGYWNRVKIKILFFPKCRGTVTEFLLVLSVNISALQYQKEDFVETLLNIIHKYDVDPDEIELEITESILIDDFSAVTEKMQIV